MTRIEDYGGCDECGESSPITYRCDDCGATCCEWHCFGSTHTFCTKCANEEWEEEPVAKTKVSDDLREFCDRVEELEGTIKEMREDICHWIQIGEHQNYQRSQGKPITTTATEAGIARSRELVSPFGPAAPEELLPPVEERRGFWLFREDPNHYWRLTTVKDGKATGGWIHGELEVANMRGEWKAPDADELSEGKADSMGRVTS